MSGTKLDRTCWLGLRIWLTLGVIIIFIDIPFYQTEASEEPVMRIGGRNDNITNYYKLPPLTFKGCDQNEGVSLLFNLKHYRVKCLMIS